MRGEYTDALQGIDVDSLRLADILNNVVDFGPGMAPEGWYIHAVIYRL